MEDFIIKYGLWAFAAALFLDDGGISIVPITTILFSYSIYARHHPEFSIIGIYIIAITIPPIANRIIFHLGKHGARKWLLIHGYKIFLPYEKIQKAENFLEKYGEKTILVTSAFSIRPIAALIAGSLNMNSFKFSFYNIIGVIIWATFITSTGYIWGKEIWGLIKNYWWILAICIGIYVIIHLWKTIKKAIMVKKILVIGNGGREHAICDALMRSQYKTEIFNFANSINPGIKKLVKEIQIGDILNNKEIQKYAKTIKPTFCIIGPDDPIGNGLADDLKNIKIPCFAPTRKCAQLESSKSFTRNLLKKYNIKASPDFIVSKKETEKDIRKIFYEKHKGLIVIKADGLLGGKGVLVANDHFHTFEETENFSKESIKKFGKVVLEECLEGEEFSLISIVDGKTVLDCPAIQDHKRAFENDTRPNTGGMGTISDKNHSLPFLRKKDLEEAHQITVKVMQALQKETGEIFTGVMYGGFMATKKGIKLIEYNVRFGDPEGINILSLLQTDFIDVCEKAINGKLEEIKKLEFREQATVLKYLCPKGYPDSPIKNIPITIDPQLYENENQKVFMASVEEKNNEILLKGSRAIGILGIGKNIEEANKNCEALIPFFKGDLFYRKDIGTNDLIEKRKNHIKKLRGKFF